MSTIRNNRYRDVVGIVLMALAMAPGAAFAQAATPPSTNFAYCQVEDSGNREIWVSQVFPAPASAGLMALDLATEFHDYVATLGGAGNKQCLVAPREQAEATRAQVAQIMGKRVFGVRVYKWHDVQWTPSPAAYAGVKAPVAAAPEQYVYCRLTDVDKRTMVTSPVFVQALPRADDARHFAILSRWARTFGESASAASGVAPDALCIASDTRGEADKSRIDYQHGFPFARLRVVELPWMPGAGDTAPTSAAPTMAATPAAGDDVEADFWQRIGSSRQAADFDDYLAAFPQGRHAPIARLELRRLRGGAGAASAAVGAVVAPTAAPADPITQRVATESFFRVPPAAAGAAAIERSGTRRVGTVAVAMTLNAQRVAGGNVCHVKSVAGVAGTTRHRFEGDSWAGLVPLVGTMQSQGSAGSADYAIRATAIDALEGQPFPLVEGKGFAYRFTQATTPAGGAPLVSTMSNRCVVGATGPANAVVPGAAGTATELHCVLGFEDASIPSQQRVMHWFSSTGCFVEDPSR